MSNFFVFLLLVFLNSHLLFAEIRYKINNLGLDHTHSHAYCINNLSEIYGTFDVSNSEGRHKSAFYWSPEMGLMELPEGAFTPYQKVQVDAALLAKVEYNDNLNLAERYRSKKRRCKKVESIFSAINNLNEIVGTVTAYGVPIIGIPDGCISHAFLIRGSEMIDIGKNYSAIDINDKSQVLLVETGKRFTTSQIWDNGNFIKLWQGGWPKAINNCGSAVGFYANGAAVIWEDGKLNLLYDLLENPEGWEKLCIAEDINDRGEIVGYGFYQGCQSAFLLTPL